jgi:hypothetical protein
MESGIIFDVPAVQDESRLLLLHHITTDGTRAGVCQEQTTQQKLKFQASKKQVAKE